MSGAAADAPFWEKPLDQLDAAQWEALCDGCGRCCLHKIEDVDTGRIYFTNVTCRLLDNVHGRCGDYANRFAKVPDCLRLSPEKIADLVWLPQSCAYRLRAEGRPLPEWHYLVCGDRDRVQTSGHGVSGWTVGEAEVTDWEEHIVAHPV